MDGVDRLYTVYDRAAEVSGPVFEAPNDAVASRAYRNMMKDVAAYDRASYQLFLVGEYDTRHMVIKASAEPVRVEVELGRIDVDPRQGLLEGVTRG